MYDSKSTSLLQSIYKRRKHCVNEEIERYFDLPQEDSKIDLILWRKTHKLSFPKLFRFAFNILVIPATSVPSEQIFSKAGELVNNKRNNLSKDTIRLLMCLNSMLNFFNK